MGFVLVLLTNRGLAFCFSLALNPSIQGRGCVIVKRDTEKMRELLLQFRLEDL